MDDVIRRFEQSFNYDEAAQYEFRANIDLLLKQFLRVKGSKWTALSDLRLKACEGIEPGPHRSDSSILSQEIMKACREREIHITPRQRIGGRLETALFPSIKDYRIFEKSRPKATPGRTSDRTNYDRSMAYAPSYNQD